MMYSEFPGKAWTHVPHSFPPNKKSLIEHCLYIVPHVLRLDQYCHAPSNCMAWLGGQLYDLSVNENRGGREEKKVNGLL